MGRSGVSSFLTHAALRGDGEVVPGGETPPLVLLDAWSGPEGREQPQPGLRQQGEGSCSGRWARRGRGAAEGPAWPGTQTAGSWLRGCSPGRSRGEGKVPVPSVGHPPSWDPRAALCSISAAAGAPAGVLAPS